LITKCTDFKATRGTNFPLNPHPKMPNMSLTRKEAAEIVAYIVTLTLRQTE
jgi:hypothetical protein